MAAGGTLLCALCMAQSDNVVWCMPRSDRLWRCQGHCACRLPSNPGSCQATRFVLSGSIDGSSVLAQR